jgi:hypothetical protein
MSTNICQDESIDELVKVRTVQLDPSQVNIELQMRTKTAVNQFNNTNAKLDIESQKPTNTYRSSSGVITSFENCTTVCCILLVVLIFVGLLLSLAISALAIGSNFKNDQCIGTYASISFKYDTWLLTYGITNTIMISLLLLCGMCYMCTESDAYKLFAIFIYGIFCTFHFAWYVVGAVLYFNTVSNSCQAGKPLHDFGLALFIIDTISWTFICLGGGKKAT